MHAGTMAGIARRYLRVCRSGLEPAAFSRDYLSMGAITLLLAAGAYLTFFGARGARQPGLGRTLGVVLLTAYAGYYVLLFNSY